MSGICGAAYRDEAKPVALDPLFAMRSTLTHRGPDAAGHWVGRGVGLGYRGLAIEGNAPQPASAADGGVQLVLDGRIYNLQDLRTDLSGLGRAVQRCTPAELLVAAYQAFGIGFLERLNGMFALALYDLANRTLVLARDPLGVKPLFYEVTPSALYFGSEIKAILAGTARRGAASHAAVQEYLIFRYVAGERTFFDGIRRLPPGHYAVWQEGTFRLHRYWALPPLEARLELAEGEAVTALDGHLTEAVRAQVLHEAPLGSFCSGGVDSGMITGYAATARGGGLPTFSVGFQDPAWDETTLARDTAERFGTTHQVLVVGEEAFPPALADLIWHNDEPLGHPNAVALFLLGRLARDSVSAVLAGEGADELFGGYPRYHIARLRGALDPLPGWTTHALAGAARRIPGHRAALLANLLPLSLEEALICNSAYVQPAQVARLTGPPIAEALTERRRLLDEALVPGDPIASISRYELLTYLGSGLDRLDRMAMASGLESRLPFLDLRLVEWACGLDSSYKVRGKENKYVLRQVARRMLGAQVVDGRKSGFGVPLVSWFRGPAFGGLVERLRDPAHPAAALFEHRAVESLLREHLAATADHSELLWLLTNVYLWHERHAP